MGDATAPDPRLGSVIGGRFRIDAVLGQGGMGTVYRGTQLSVDRQVAIKLISHHVATQAEFIRRFSREAKVTSQLSHPHTIRLHDFGTTEDGALFLVVELLQGRELGRLIEQEGRLAPGRALALVQKLLKSLAEAHAKGIVHRDLKPDNVFMCEVPGEGDFPKVMDFGIASAGLSPDATKLTMEGSLLGTPAYMSPEQAQGAPAGPPADIYALGVMLYEMLTGRLPFVANTPLSLMMKHVSEPPPPLREIDAVFGHDHPIQRLLDRWLAKDPAARPANATQALAELEAVMEGAAPASSAAPVPTSAWDVARQADVPDDPEAASPSGPLRTLSSGQGDRRQVWWLALASAGVLSLGGLGAWAAVSSRQGQRPPEPADAGQGQGPTRIAASAGLAETDGALSRQPGEDAGGVDARDGQAPRQNTGDHAQTSGQPPSRTGGTGSGARRNGGGTGSGARHTGEGAHGGSTGGATGIQQGGSRPGTDSSGRPHSSGGGTGEDRGSGGQLRQPRTGSAVDPPPPPKPQPETREEKRQRMVREGTPYPSIAAAKAAYNDRSLSRDDYEDVVWALKVRRKQSRLRMAAEGTPYPSIAAVKAAYREGRIGEERYEDIVWALKRRYKERVRDLKLDYKAGKIDRATYERLVRAAEADYRG